MFDVCVTVPTVRLNLTSQRSRGVPKLVRDEGFVLPIPADLCPDRSTPVEADVASAFLCLFDDGDHYRAEAECVAELACAYRTEVLAPRYVRS